MKRIASVLGLTLLAGAAVAQEAPVVDPRELQIELREGGRLVASPTVRVQVGRPAAVSSGSYSFRLRMDRGTAVDGGQAPFLIRSSLYRSDSDWALVASPAMTVVEGEEAQLRFAGNDGRQLSMAVLIR